MDTLTLTPDWHRERRGPGTYEPGKYLIEQIRRYQSRGFLARLMRPWIVLKHRFWSAVTGADIPLRTRIGGGLMMIHPNGVVIHPDAEIGANCMIFQQVTIGTGHGRGVPEIGSGVMIGAGAKVLGGIRVGHGARIGANAVVLEDVPAGATAVGIPAEIVTGGGGR